MKIIAMLMGILLLLAFPGHLNQILDFLPYSVESMGDSTGSPYLVIGTNTWAVAPEPSSLLLLGAGLVGVATLIRRRLHSEK